MIGVHVVEWYNGHDSGILGIFSSRVKAESAIKEDEKLYDSEYGMEYHIEYYDIDEVQ